jgi:hypothetical protein
VADEKFNRDVAAVEAAGKARFGDAWDTTINAVRRAVGPAGIEEGAMRQILNTADPAGLLHNAGREQLLNEADSGNKESEFAYSEMRAKEREQHRRLKGR